MKTIGWFVVAVLALPAGPALAQSKACSKADEAAAEKALDGVVNWQLMSKAWKQFRHCDSGATEEMFTDAFMRLAVEWKHVDELAALSRADPEFKAFVKRHVTNPKFRDDAQSVYSRAKMSCPPDQAAFCAELAEMAQWAQ